MPNTEPLIIGVDLGGTVLASKKKKTKADRGVDAVIDRIETTVRKMMDKMDATLADFEALCIGAPGAVDPETGVVHEAPNLNWENVSLGERLRAAQRAAGVDGCAAGGVEPRAARVHGFVTAQCSPPR